MNALQMMRWTMWHRNRLALIVIGAYVALASTYFAAVDLNKASSVVTVCIAVLGIFAGLILFGVFIHQDAEVGTKGSSYPQYLFSLPIRTIWLVLAPMVSGTLVVLLSGFLISTALRHGGVPAPVYWPTCMIAAFLALLQAVFWYPIGFSYSKMILTLFGIAFTGFYVAVGLNEGLTDARIGAYLMLFVLLMYGIAYHGVIRARQGEGQLVRFEPTISTSQVKPPRTLKPFKDSKQAQRWYEWRQHGIVLPCLVIFLFVVFTLPLKYSDTTSPIGIIPPDAKGIVPTVPTYVWAYFPTMLSLIPLMAWIVGCGARRSDVKHTDRTLHLFFGVRPMADATMVNQKFWAALKASLVSWGIILVIGLSLFRLTGGHYNQNLREYVREDPQPIWSVLQPYMTSSMVLGLLGALTLMIAWTWRNYIIGYWVELSGIRWLHLAYPFTVIFLVLLTQALESVIPRETINHWITLQNVTVLTWSIFVLRLAIGSVLASKLIRNGTLKPKALLRGLGVYAVLAAAIVTIVMALSRPIREAYVDYEPSKGPMMMLYVLGFIMLWIPFVRVLLAPLMLARNRHRAS